MKKQLAIALTSSALLAAGSANATITTIIDEDFSGNQINDPVINELPNLPDVTFSGDRAIYTGENHKYLYVIESAEGYLATPSAAR